MIGEGAIGLTITFAALLVVLPLALTHAAHRSELLSEAWRKLAYRHGLRFDAGRWTKGPNVTGSLGGRSFVMRRMHGNKDSTPVYMELNLDGPLPDGLHIKRAKSSAHSHAPGPLPGGGRSGASPAAAGQSYRHLFEGNPDTPVDEHIKVEAGDAEGLPHYLTSARQRAACHLIEAGGELVDHKLRVQVTKASSDLEALDGTVRILRKVAPILDTSR